jgi:hypothetical protein
MAQLASYTTVISRRGLLWTWSVNWGLGAADAKQVPDQVKLLVIGPQRPRPKLWTAHFIKYDY